MVADRLVRHSSSQRVYLYGARDKSHHTGQEYIDLVEIVLSLARASLEQAPLCPVGEPEEGLERIFTYATEYGDCAFRQSVPQITKFKAGE